MPFNAAGLRNIVLALGLMGACGAVSAQEAVPLTDELFDLHWVAIEYEGKIEGVELAPTTLVVSDREFGHVGGQTGCETDWTAKVEIALPKVTFSEVEGFYEDSCPAYKNTIALLNALEQVSYAETSPEGLELKAEDGRRVMLMVAGG
ncbi:hypothetical protein JHL21_02370 [Devosia sp. WQ 349]|uniref:hypothetical protein n=1 Tax=Devosia sp. WQ 349K1 TaxID=2800329 RepID=UPI001906F0D4|nr:hypothetical protein [Devosia sp. WQ 349K1]MBK1793340.1 hypothetical protein [Devosia sp. WQ 349K1]